MRRTWVWYNKQPEVVGSRWAIGYISSGTSSGRSSVSGTTLCIPRLILGTDCGTPEYCQVQTLRILVSVRTLPTIYRCSQLGFGRTGVKH